MRVKSYKVWLLEGRLYPSIPALDFLDGFPPIILELLYYITIASLVILFVKPNHIGIQITLFLSVFISAIFEMASWQPWEYQFLCMIAIIILGRKNQNAMYTALILIMASIYFYSGVQKFNGGFLHSVWKGLILRKFFGLSDINLIVHYTGLVLPLLEAFAGLGLVILKNKKLPAYFLIGMHFFILVLLGTVQGFNIVLPWNIVMIVMLHLLFIKNVTPFSPNILFTRRYILIFILWTLMPAFSFFGYWEQKLSSNLFSGRHKNLAICMEASFPTELQPYLLTDQRYKVCKGKERLTVSNWSIKELAVLPPNSDWYYSKFKVRFAKKYKYLDAEYFTFTYPYKKFDQVD